MARPRLFSFFGRQNASGLPLPIASAPVTAPVEPDAGVAEMVALTGKLAAVTAERDQSQAAYEAGKVTAAELDSAILALKASLANVTAERDALTTERDALKAESARTREEITSEIRNREMATLAASQGIPAGAEIVPANGPGASKADELEAVLTEMKACSNPGQKGLLAAKASKIRADIRAGN